MKSFYRIVIYLILISFIHPVDLQAQILNLDSLGTGKPSDSERDMIIELFNITLKDGDLGPRTCRM